MKENIILQKQLIHIPYITAIQPITILIYSQLPLIILILAKLYILAPEVGNIILIAMGIKHILRNKNLCNLKYLMK